MNRIEKIFGKESPLAVADSTWPHIDLNAIKKEKIAYMSTQTSMTISRRYIVEMKWKICWDTESKCIMKKKKINIERYVSTIIGS